LNIKLHTEEELSEASNFFQKRSYLGKFYLSLCPKNVKLLMSKLDCRSSNILVSGLCEMAVGVVAGLCWRRVQEEQMDELNKTAERNTELEARIGFMLSSQQVS